MIINFVLMKQVIVKKGIQIMQNYISYDLDKAFWIVSFVAFIASPFITNDGLCLLLVDPVLDAFLPPTNCNLSSSPSSPSASPFADSGNQTSVSESNCSIFSAIKTKCLPFCCSSPLQGYVSTWGGRHSSVDLKRPDGTSERFYFMIGIACSANLGSSMTFTGNPQNIIISIYLSKYLSGGMFFGLLFIPATLCWLINMWYINRMRKKNVSNLELNRSAAVAPKNSSVALAVVDEESSSRLKICLETIEAGNDEDKFGVVSVSPMHSSCTADENEDGYLNEDSKEIIQQILTEDSNNKSELKRRVVSRNDANSANDAIDNRIEDGVDADVLNLQNYNFDDDEDAIMEISSLPPLTFIFFLLLILLEFLGIIPLTIIYSIIAIIVVVAVLLVNYLRGVPQTRRVAHKYIPARYITVPVTINDRIGYITKFVEQMFKELDYNLIIIFTGLFIVSGSFVDTAIPQIIWYVVAGSHPFQSANSIFMISLYTIVCSQLVGNVALVIMASDQISVLPSNWQILGWSLLAWVSTIAGNFTLTGSAANIIVAEKAMRHHKKQINLPSSSHNSFSNNNNNNDDGDSSRKNGDNSEIFMSAKVNINSVDHFKVCGGLTLVCITLGTLIIYGECRIFHIV